MNEIQRKGEIMDKEINEKFDETKNILKNIYANTAIEYAIQ